MTEQELFKFQRRTVTLINNKIRHHQMLYKLTNHSKKKAKHLANVRFMQDILLSAYEEYGW